ncbi:MAG TPA: deoxyribonuclease IV [Persephonella sp.]|uniref:Probable endonuclease 4 n=1 Tax=Persephonella marina (strain DSM 14350 / EX-H1) TaxID=123214 RepID=END4_PERMH|nr:MULTISPECIES: deoxyribonuclease IV [Persephonella]C0QRI1.1 RecName: Full=Probable endonuclease 4; AltName: Full=Endodeoxyribonuclease IV; AltName: Full=Endonuclease IV [Persephonella marina EX-H1]ACO03565.1 probable endonuclease 4 (Endonuclease IV)(Endodeoxyribonuclease IV) [Persephonella marina EX-H1]HCB69022.1 deoxyribonuclease IV [Persephonella sp.]
MVKIGAHVSSSKSLDLVFDRGREIGADTIQFFLSSPRSWHWKERSDEEKELFIQKRRETGISPVIAHSSYLFNLASSDPVLRKKSINGVIRELKLCEELKIDYYVIHAGKSKGLKESEAVKNIIDSVKEIFSKVKLKHTFFLYETLAGQKGEIGKTTDELAQLMEPFKKENTGVCVDTCHIYSAGYKINDEEGFYSYRSELSKKIGLENVKVIHCNDSKTPFNSKRDRHEHIGEGSIGYKGFEFFLNDEYFRRLPFILETPKTADWDIKNMERLRRLIRTAPVAQ